MCKIISVAVAGGALKCQSNRIGQNNNLQAKNKCRGEKNEENHLFPLLILDIGQFNNFISLLRKKSPCYFQQENKEEQARKGFRPISASQIFLGM